MPTLNFFLSSLSFLCILYIDIPGLETRSSLLFHISRTWFGITLTSVQRLLPVCIWAQMTSLSDLTNDLIDGQNRDEHTHEKNDFCLDWCVSAPSSSGRWRYIFLHASLHRNAVLRLNWSLSWQQTALWSAGSVQPTALNCSHFQIYLKWFAPLTQLRVVSWS